MAYKTKIILDSVCNETGKRITTFELTYPRFIHSELMTHRLFSRNSASSRAIPVKKMLDQIVNDPAIPKFWGKNQAGMQAAEELTGSALDAAKSAWLAARDEAVSFAEYLNGDGIGLHKQIANRITEPWMFITVLVTSTEWDNWYRLRDSEFAQPEIAWVARDMRRIHMESNPQVLRTHNWHLPFIDDKDRWDTIEYGCEDLQLEALKKISAGRCARVSYLTHDGKRDVNEDIILAERLMKSGHWSPFEHCAQALDRDETRVGNFLGWRQYRAEVDENFVEIVCPCCEHRWK